MCIVLAINTTVFERFVCMRRAPLPLEGLDELVHFWFYSQWIDVENVYEHARHLLRLNIPAIVSVTLKQILQMTSTQFVGALVSLSRVMSKAL